MTTFEQIYESEQVSVILISSTYHSGYTTTDFNPLPSISFPLKGAFEYRSGRFNCIADSNVVLIEIGNIEYDVTKFEEFNYDQTLCFQFKGKKPDPSYQIFKKVKRVQSFKSNPEIDTLARHFLSSYSAAHNLLNDQIIDELLIATIANKKSPAAEITKVTPWHSMKIDTAKDYIHSHMSEDISLCDISAASHISTFHFSRIFKKLTGYSPYAYLLQVRMIQAQKLLREGSSVTSTAFEVGFNSVANFSYRFKKIVGMTPSKYQKSNKSKIRNPYPYYLTRQ